MHQLAGPRRRTSRFFKRLTRSAQHEATGSPSPTTPTVWEVLPINQGDSSVESIAQSVIRFSPPNTQPSTRQTSVGSSYLRRDSDIRTVKPKSVLDMNIIPEIQTQMKNPPSLSSYPQDVKVRALEKAAAANAYFETYYKDFLSDRPSPRTVRLETMRRQMAENSSLGEKEIQALERMFFREESAHLRRYRVLMYESLKAASCQADNGPDLCSKMYKSVKILGKGSFGVVRLVKERQRNGPTGQPGQVFAMKVIKKTEMIRSCQEGHLRAERDFLIASEHSQW